MYSTVGSLVRVSLSSWIQVALLTSRGIVVVDKYVCYFGCSSWLHGHKVRVIIATSWSADWQANHSATSWPVLAATCVTIIWSNAEELIITSGRVQRKILQIQFVTLFVSCQILLINAWGCFFHRVLSGFPAGRSPSSWPILNLLEIFYRFSLYITYNSSRRALAPSNEGFFIQFNLKYAMQWYWNK